MTLHPIIDTHVHFWDLLHPTITWNWLAPQNQHPILGNIDAIKSVRYDVAALAAEARFAGVTGAVHVQAAVGTSEPLDETLWLTKMAENSPMPFVIVAGVDLCARDVTEQLSAHARSPLLRGIRDYGREDYLSDPAFERGVTALEEFGLALDLDCKWEDMSLARDLARSAPGTTVVLEHIGYPRDTSSPEYFESWKAGIESIAEAPNVMCKISGLGMNRVAWTIEDLRPWVEHCIQTFGPDRCMFGSNWPVDRLYASYDAYVAAYRTLIESYTNAEQTLLLSGTANRIYSIPGVTVI
jgi:predicted TIM-barrel fold metal-dependent hydrolase